MNDADLNYFECPHGCPDCSACRNSKAARNLADAILVRNQRWADAKEAKAKLYAAERRIATLEADLAVVRRHRDALETHTTAFQRSLEARIAELERDNARLRAREDEALAVGVNDMLRAGEQHDALEARIAELTREREVEREIAALAEQRAVRYADDLARVTQASKYNCDIADQALAAFFAAQDERDEAVGLLRRRHGMECPTYDDNTGTCGGCEVSSLLARLAPAPEKETTP